MTRHHKHFFLFFLSSFFFWKRFSSFILHDKLSKKLLSGGTDSQAVGEGTQSWPNRKTLFSSFQHGIIKERKKKIMPKNVYVLVFLFFLVVIKKKSTDLPFSHLLGKNAEDNCGKIQYCYFRVLFVFSFRFMTNGRKINVEINIIISKMFFFVK